MSILGKTKCWGRSYTTIPSTVRKILEIEKGDQIEWIFENNKIIIKKAKDNES